MERRGAPPSRIRRQLALELGWETVRGRDCLSVRGWPRGTLEELRRCSAAALAARLAVLPSDVVELAGGPGATFQPTLGAFELDGDAVRFTPRLPFVAGLAYTLLIDGEGWTIERPRREGAPQTAVLAIHPTAPRLPLNQLKLYISFSAAMSEGWANRAVVVRRARDGVELEGVFLPMEPELWDPDRTRLTLLLDPGRIKRGLAPHRDLGYPLTEGVAIVVAVEPGFRDAQGRPLTSGAERRYEVGAPVRDKVDPRAWSIEPPSAGTRAPLTLRFDRPLDHALLEHAVSVHDAEGRELGGAATIGRGESSWVFVPHAPWQRGRFDVVLEARLEDLAGNSLARVFDRNLDRPQDDPLTISRVTLAFRC